MNSTPNMPAGELADFKPGLQTVEKPAARFYHFGFLGERARDGIWPRIGFLLGVLCLLKIVMLISLRKHLFEIHWRVSGQPYDWVNQVAFYLFAGLVGLHLWRLGSQCMVLGRRTVRTATICVLILGAAFIFMTFHEGDKNYFSPVMNGVLAWKDLRWYLALNFFFREPYLAFWILGYSIVYYGLVRTGREHLILRVTALCSAVYIALYLSDLTDYHDALIIVDVIGIASLLAAGRTRQALRLPWLGLFLLATTIIFGLFYGLDPRLTVSQMSPEFAMLTGFCIVLIGGVTVFAGRAGFFSGWSWALPFAVAAFLLFVNVRYGPAPNYNKLLCDGFTFSRYFLGEFLVAGLLFLLAWGYRFWRTGGSLWWLDVVNFSLILLALADLRLSQIMGVRLDWPALSLAMGETPRMMWRMAKPYLPALVGALLVGAGLYATLFQLLKKSGRPVQTHRSQRFSRGANFIVLVLVLLGVAGERLVDQDKAQGQSALLLVETSPLWRRAMDPSMDGKTFRETAQLLGMDQLVKSGAGSLRAKRDLNVVVIFQESTYNKYLSLFSGTENTEPLLSSYRDRMEIFPNFFSSFAGSINARFAAFTGLYPGRDYKEFTIQRVEVKSIFELLHDQGYTCSLFYSSFLDYTGFRDFLRNRNLDAVYDADTMPGPRKTKAVSWGLREEETLGAIQTQIKDYAARNQKFFLTYVPAAPHNPFDGTPERFRKHKIENVGDYTPVYVNELLYMDWVVSSIIDQLKDAGVLDKTLIIITGDHGEMLGANNGPIGHGWVVSPELANVPLIVMDPANRGYHLNYTIGSQVDLPLTILDLLGLPMPSGQLTQGNSLYSISEETERTIYLNSMRQYGIIKGRNMICGERGIREPQSAFAITNAANSTLYTEIPAENITAPPISTFDRFQQNLLHHYSEYARTRQQPEPGK